MFLLGQLQTLEVAKRTEFGMYLCEKDSETNERVLLPKTQVPADLAVGDDINVFLYKDSEDRLIATTTKPKITLNQLAILEVKDVNRNGAFLDWGLTKELFLPYKEQKFKVKPGDSVLVRLYIDKSHRLAASMKIYEHLKTDSPYKKDDKVYGLVYEVKDEIGAFVAVDNQYSALIPKKELFTKLKIGDKVEARITSVTEDRKLNLSLRDKSYVAIDKDAYMIYRKLLSSRGFLPYNDKTDAELIKAQFNLSKNAFKRAIGRLLKEGKIEITTDGISLIK